MSPDPDLAQRSDKPLAKYPFPNAKKWIHGPSNYACCNDVLGEEARCPLVVMHAVPGRGLGFCDYHYQRVKEYIS